MFIYLKLYGTQNIRSQKQNETNDVEIKLKLLMHKP